MRSRQKRTERGLSRREREIMDVVYRLGEVTVAQIATNLPDPPSRDAVRRMAHILEEKGYLEHRQDGPRNVYRPVVQRATASRNALDHMVETFFGGSTDKLVAALLDLKRDELGPADLRRLSALIDRAAEEERGR